MVQASSDAEAHQLLKREILSLGGDLDDFELLKQVEDGEEEEWRPKKPTQGQVHFPVIFLLCQRASELSEAVIARMESTLARY